MCKIGEMMRQEVARCDSLRGRREAIEIVLNTSAEPSQKSRFRYRKAADLTNHNDVALPFFSFSQARGRLEAGRLHLDMQVCSF